MPDFPIDPELRIRTSPPVVLRRTTEAVGFIRKMTLSRPGHGWRDLLQTFDAARDEWSAMEAVVHLELLLEAEDLLIEERTAHASPPGQDRFRAASVREPNSLHIAMLERVCQRAHDFDLLHFHLDYYPFSLFSRQSTPFVTTLHGRLDLPEHQVVFATFPFIPVISISDAQRRPVSRAGWIRTIHHGLPERLLTPQPITPTYFAFLGRISP